MADRFKVKGLDDALANLRSLSVDIAAKAIPKAAKAAAYVFRDDVKPRIPRKTGNLAKTLRVARKKDTGPGFIVGYSVRVGTATEFQAFLLEFGFHHVGGEWVQVPFMRPSFDTKSGAALDAFVQSLRQSIDTAQSGGLL